MTVDGWVPVDPLTLETSYAGVYAVGDVTSVGTPKAGVFAERQGAVVAQRIIDAIRGSDTAASYDGRGICYLEVGDGEVGKVDVTFRPGSGRPASSRARRSSWPGRRAPSARAGSPVVRPRVAAARLSAVPA